MNRKINIIMDEEKRTKCNEVLDLMMKNEVSIKELMLIIAEETLDGGVIYESIKDKLSAGKIKLRIIGSEQFYEAAK